MNKINRFDKLFGLVFLTIIIVSSVITGQHNEINVIGIHIDTFYISLIASVIGVLFVISVRLGIKISMILGSIFSILYCMLAFYNKNYGDFTVNLYCAIVCLLGFINWSRNSKGKEVKIRDLNKRETIKLGSISIIMYICLLFILAALGTRNLYIDALITTFVILANTLMALRYRQFWYGFNIVNTLHVILWSMRLYEGVPNALPLLIMFFMYLLNSLIATKQYQNK